LGFETLQVVALAFGFGQQLPVANAPSRYRTTAESQLVIFLIHRYT
jgi:hypothetical protein